MIKGIIRFGLEKPILNYMLLVFLFVLSIFAYNTIPKEIFPVSKLDSINISGAYSGASSDVLDDLVVQKLEDELKSVSELNKISTVIKNGYFSIDVELKRGEKVSPLVDEIKDIVTKIKVDLPSDMDEPSVKEMTHAFPLVTVAISADKSTEALLDIASDIKAKLVKLSDLSEINIYGDTDKELLITFDESKIEAFGLDTTQVINLVASMSSIFPAGIIKDKKRHYYLSSQNGKKDIKDIENIILRISNKSIYLKDIAKINYQLADVNTISHFNGKPDMSIGINKGKSGDAISLVKEIKTILAKEHESAYKDVTFDTYTDTSIWIKNRLNTVVSNIVFGIILLSIALFIFINVRIAFVVAVGIPTSFMIGLIAAEQMGYSLNMLSLLGALLALGMLVDEAIVVAENIYRHLEMGKSKFDAAYEGAIEVYPAVLTATATTIFAFLPILLMTGQTGVFLKILPIMISILLFSSLIEAFFFLPLHAKHILKTNHNEKKSELIWEWNKKLYHDILDFVLRWKYIAIIVLVTSIIAMSIFLFKQLKFQFLPDFDTTQVYISGSVGVGKDIKQTEKVVFDLEKKLLEEFSIGNEIDSISSVVGFKLDGKQLPQNEEFYFQIFVNLQERAPSNFFDRYINPILSPKYDDTDMTREQSAKEISSQITSYLEKQKDSLYPFDELKVYVPGAGIVKYDIEIALSGDDKKVIDALDIIKNELNKIKGVRNISDDVLLGNMDLKFQLNKYGLGLGFNETNIVNILKPFYFKGNFSKMFDDAGMIDIIFVSKNKDNKISLDNFWLSVPGTNQKVLLNDVVDFYTIPTLSQVFKENGVAIKSITAGLNGITSDEVYEKLNPVLEDIKKDITITIKGEQEENQKVKKEMMEAFVIALILIFIALIWMFDSIIKSLIILSTIPLSILGVLAGHFIMDIHLTMPGLIGIVGLAGVIVNDGIIMMDFIQKAKDLKEMKSFAMLRLRPILLTSLTTILGLSTLIFFASGQSLILQPMAVSLGFGILWATVLNLYYVPIVYRVIYLRKEKDE